MKSIVLYSIAISLLLLSACNNPKKPRKNFVDILPIEIQNFDLEIQNIGNRILTWESNNYSNSNIDAQELAQLRERMEALSRQLQANDGQTYQIQDLNRRLSQIEAKQKTIFESQIAQFKQKIKEFERTYQENYKLVKDYRRAKNECPCFQKAYRAMEDAIQHYENQPDKVKEICRSMINGFEKKKLEIKNLAEKHIPSKKYIQCLKEIE